MAPIIIIGSGLAGYTLAREFRQHDSESPLSIITADEGRYYSKPMLSSALAQGKNIDTLTLSSPEEMSDKLNIKIYTDTYVEEVDAAGHRLLANGNWIEYRALVIAVGASPIRLPFEGSGADDIIVVNNLADYGQFRELLQKKQRVAIIGPGLIGCEFANDLLQTGYQVTIIGPDPYPISTLLPEAAALSLQFALEQAGADWQLKTTTKRIDKVADGYKIELTNGQVIMAGLVLSAVGLRPDIRLASQMGLEVNRGIVTDRTLQTSQADIYALGDCAEVEGLNLPFVAPLMFGAKALARTLAGEVTPVSYPAMPVVIKTTLHPVVVAPPGPVEGEWQVETLDDGVKALYKSAEGAVLGLALTGSAVSEKQALTKLLPSLL
jgi:rubredoxin-NAD+ reductase